MRDIEALNLRQWYREKTGKSLNITEPKSLGAKLQWLKIYDCNEEKQKFADRYFAKEFLIKNYKEHIIPNVAVWDDAKKINYDELPEEFIIKASHGPVEKYINKNSVSKEELIGLVEKWIATNFAYDTKQYELEDIKRRVICEEYIKEKTRIECWLLNGELQFIVAIDQNDCVGVYDKKWSLQKNTPYSNRGNTIIDKPECLEELLKLADEICHKDQAFERIDFIIDKDNNFYFDGYYYAPQDGICNWSNRKADLKYGKSLTLPADIKRRENKEIKIISGPKYKQIDKNVLKVEYKLNINDKTYSLYYKLSGENVDSIEKTDSVDAAALAMLLPAIYNGYNIVSEKPISRELFYILECNVVRRIITIDIGNAYRISINASKKENDLEHKTWTLVEQSYLENGNATFGIYKDNDATQSTELIVETNITEIVELAFGVKEHKLTKWLNLLSHAFLMKSNIRECILDADEEDIDYNWTCLDLRMYSLNWLFYSFSIDGIKFSKKYDNSKTKYFDPDMENSQIRYYKIRQLASSKLWRKDYFYCLDYYYHTKSKRDNVLFNEIVNERYDNNKALKFIMTQKFKLERIIYGVQYNDFFYKSCFDKSLFFCRRIMTFLRCCWINDLLNDSSYICFVGDKRLFAIKWAKYFGRKWCDETVSEEDFINIFSTVKEIIVKPYRNFGGIGISVYNTGDYKTLDDIYKEIKAQFADSYIVEEYVEQTGFLHSLNESTMNTIRITTIRNPYNGDIRVVNSFLRVGKADSKIDNYTSGGVAYTIDTNTGAIGSGMSKDSNGKEWKYHPGTKKSYTGLIIPKWSDAIKMCIEAHSIAPSGLNLIGWDVCINEDSCILIEANTLPGFGRLYSKNENQWKPIVKFIESFVETK